jgi:trehalose 2-sulfotransferase
VSSTTSYLLCGTPRTGSTLLCSLLSSTGVAGHPDSYFRGPDEQAWADELGVPARAGRALDYADFIAAVRDRATSDNGVFGARVMWGSLERVIDGLARGSARPDVEVLQEAFGPLTALHLRRQDTVAQAVSWARAEQTGYWQQGDVAQAKAQLDLDRLTGLVRTIREDNQAWQAWFGEQDLTPLVVTYEELAGDRRGTVAKILAHLGLTVPSRWQPASPHHKQADELNAQWTQAYRERFTRDEASGL